MNRRTIQFPGRLLLTAGALMLACSTPPTATNDPDPNAILLGRGNEQGARLWLPGGSNLPCAVVDGVGALVPVPCSQQVATPSPTSNAMVVVKASNIFNPTGKAVHWGPENPGAQWAGLFYLNFGVTGPPYPCGVQIGPGSTYFVDIVFTTDWHATVTPSGEATVTCHYSNESAWFPPPPPTP